MSPVDFFEIPEELAKELSELLTKQSIRDRLLLELIDNPEMYDALEAKLIPITSRIDEIKIKITREFVPEKYNSSEYIWNYLGWNIDKNKVEVFKQH